MVEDETNGPGSGILEAERDDSGVEAKRRQIAFRRATKAQTDRAFGNRSTTTRKRASSQERKTEVTVGDSRPENAKEVKGKAPPLPTDEKKPATRSRSKAHATLEDSSNYAQFLLSAIEVACVTAAGPTGEMSQWERGVLSAPLQRMIQRTPVKVIEKGGIFIDSGFLIVGFAVYFGRVMKGVKLPSFAQPKPKETVEDKASPVPAEAHKVVETIKPGDKDGLAQPVPSIISAYMNGAI